MSSIMSEEESCNLCEWVCDTPNQELYMYESFADCKIFKIGEPKSVNLFRPERKFYYCSNCTWYVADGDRAFFRYPIELSLILKEYLPKDVVHCVLMFYHSVPNKFQ